MKRTLVILALAFATAVFVAGCQSQTKAEDAKKPPADAPDSTGQKKGGPGVADLDVDR